MWILLCQKFQINIILKNLPAKEKAPGSCHEQKAGYSPGGRSRFFCHNILLFVCLVLYLHSSLLAFCTAPLHARRDFIALSMLTTIIFENAQIKTRSPAPSRLYESG